MLRLCVFTCALRYVSMSTKPRNMSWCSDEDIRSRSFSRTNCFPYCSVDVKLWTSWLSNLHSHLHARMTVPVVTGVYANVAVFVAGSVEGRSGRQAVGPLQRRDAWGKQTEISTESSLMSFDAESVWRFCSMCSAATWMKSNYSIELMKRSERQ